MKIIQAQMKDMSSSLLAELGSYRYSVFVREEGWPVPLRLHTPGQEYDKFDCSDVTWLIAWNKQNGICGCARLMPWRAPKKMQGLMAEGIDLDPATVWEMSRFSARLDVSKELPLQILWHALQLTGARGGQSLVSALTPMFERMFEYHEIMYSALAQGVLQSEDNFAAMQIPIEQPALFKKYHHSPNILSVEAFSGLGIMASRHIHGR
ncbi:acyl-homoserine-lactone synthase [Enterobacteriaceae bacterium LUAb1]